MTWLSNSLIVLAAFIVMEGIAWFSHKYIMHGLLWKLHKDHHEPSATKKAVEKNDTFFLIFATPAIICMLIGLDHFSAAFWVGIGITLYGITYFFVHDLFIHQRIKLLRNSDWLYFRAIRRAHKMHHRHLGKKHGECFGMLWAPFKYFKEAKKNVG
jgi:beta-carotene 3-hydroxylase